jgi:hypothetical protein
MIQETGKAITYFIVLFILCVASFANAVMVIDNEHYHLDLNSE